MIDSVESGEYFNQARLWYNQQYIKPITDRSYILVVFIILVLTLLGIFINLQSIYPLNQTVRYSINVKDADDFQANIIRANRNSDSLRSIALIMSEYYLLNRESYDYSLLASRINYIKNSSTKVAFREYSSQLSLANPKSFLLIYQKFAKRNVSIISSRFIESNKIEIKFSSKVFDRSQNLIEDREWLSEIEFYIDPINLVADNNTPYNFSVSDYKINLVNDRLEKSK